MPLYIGDYRRDTAHLGALEHGAYLLLIMHYWQSGGLPDDDRQLARIAGCTPAEWRRVKNTVRAFFSDGWKHNRIEFELTESARISEAGRKGGIASGEARRSAKLNRTIVERSLNDHTNDQVNDQATQGEALHNHLHSEESKNLSKGSFREAVKKTPKHGAVSADKQFVYFKRGTKEFEAYSQDFQEAMGEQPEATSDGRWFKWLGETKFLEKGAT